MHSLRGLLHISSPSFVFSIASEWDDCILFIIHMMPVFAGRVECSRINVHHIQYVGDMNE